MSSAITAVGALAGSPGTQRLRLPPSIGDTRKPASAAGKFAIGRTISCPAICAASISRTTRDTTIGPSYSSPWLPAITHTTGPQPLRIDTIGTGTHPYAERWAECGTRR